MTDATVLKAVPKNGEATFQRYHTGAFIFMYANLSSKKFSMVFFLLFLLESYYWRATVLFFGPHEKIYIYQNSREKLYAGEFFNSNFIAFGTDAITVPFKGQML